MASIGECHAGATTAAHGGGCQRPIVAAPAAHLSCTEACEAPYGHPGAARLALAEP
jgi:hypothetical protein